MQSKTTLLLQVNKVLIFLHLPSLMAPETPSDIWTELAGVVALAGQAWC